MEINHWDKFAEFCLWEMNSGGPDPQIPLVGEMSKGLSADERMWRAGCYVSVYNVPFAEAIWEHWSYKDIQGNMSLFRDWLNTEWDKIVTRVERKTVRRPEWMFEYFNSYYAFMRNDVLPAIHLTSQWSPEARYLYFWDLTISRIKRFGRYVALKLLESYSLYCNIPMTAPDIRPKDGWSPRTTLALLQPKFLHSIAREDNDPVTLQAVNLAVKETQRRLLNDYDVDIDLFKLQVVLCEYRESYESKKQYPGRSHDSELGYWHKREALWGTQPYSKNMLLARSRIFPWQHLGEWTTDWLGPRKECGQVLATYNYTWTDMLYDYKKSLPSNLSKPIWRKYEAKTLPDHPSSISIRQNT